MYPKLIFEDIIYTVPKTPDQSLEARVAARVARHNWLWRSRNLRCPRLFGPLFAPQLGRPDIVILFIVNPDVSPPLAQAAALALMACRQTVRIKLTKFATLNRALVAVINGGGGTDQEKEEEAGGRFPPGGSHPRGAGQRGHRRRTALSSDGTGATGEGDRR